ncbi:SRPBCC family protein [Kibdelosporangium persicum]|uniref:Carbon monoxide dehydrogenase subunit G n=1 Tax=Kibdelosporangium persicum TaxID=2698649 RepID=A0ABX2FER4_9PSEU|nr:SRPBCC family protein [Kibdelosporangium persicum]NRN69881.1 Carbon monoxide dehydrogenase subunit G [Kibdelosporangium persicum]
MRLEHQFTVNAPVDVVWQALLDPERVAPCMPGATLTSVDGNTFAGSVKVKLGPISLLYKGKGEFVETGTETRTVRITASGKDARSGTASADVTVTLSEKDGQTTGAVTTDLTITGKPAQFGRGMIAEVGGKLLDTFARNLAEVVAPAAKPDEPAVSEPLRVVPDQQSAEAVDLLEYAGSPVLKRVLPLVVAALVVLFLLSRRRRK